MPVVDPVHFALGAGAWLALSLAVAVRWPQLCVAYPRAVLAVVAALTVAAAACVVRLDPFRFRIGLDPSSETLLVTADPGRDVYRQAVLEFGSDDLCVIAMETPDVFREDELAALRRVTDAIRRIDGVRDAESLTNVAAFRWDSEAEWVEVGKLVDEIPSEPAELERLRVRALADRLIARTLVSADGRTAAINVTFETMTDRAFIERDLDGAIRRVLDLERGPERRFFVTGRPHIRAAAHHLMLRDLLRLIPLAVAVAALAVGLLTGSLRGTLIPLVNCLTATLWTFGAIGAVGRDLNVITLVVGPCLIVIASVYGVYIVERYDEIATVASDGRAAAGLAVADTRIAVLISGLTTMVGFAAQVTNGITATTELGLFCAFGVGCATLLSVTAVPAVLALLPLERSGDSTERLWSGRNLVAVFVGARLDALLAAIWRVEVRRPRAFLAAWAVVCAAAALAIPRIAIDTDYLTFFDASSEVRRDFDAVNELLAGTVPVFVTFDGPGEGTFREPENLRALERIEQELEAMPDVSQVLSMADLVRAVNRALAADDPAADRIPDSRQGLAEVVFMIPKDRLRRFATSDQSAANLIVRTSSMGSRAVRDLEARVQGVLADGAVPAGVTASVTGNTVLINRSADGIAGNQMLSLGLATAVILGLVWSVFRDWKLTMVAMLPNTIPVLLFYGMLGAGAAPLSVPTSLIGTIVLGIAVDDTVHFLVGYRRERAEGRTPAEAALQCMRFVGRAMVIASIMLSVGFNVMNLSEFATLRQFGYLSGATLAVCLLTDLWLLPAILVATRA